MGKRRTYGTSEGSDARLACFHGREGSGKKRTCKLPCLEGPALSDTEKQNVQAPCHKLYSAARWCRARGGDALTSEGTHRKEKDRKESLSMPQPVAWLQEAAERSAVSKDKQA